MGEVGGAKLTWEICQGDLLQQALKLLPKHIRERREKESRKRQKDRNRPIVVGSQKFLNVGALRGRVKEILNSRSDGEHLKAEGSDFKLIQALLEHHPKGAQKSEGMVGIKVAQSTQGDNRCFFMVKQDGTAEDFSAKKCLDAIEVNPPYVKAETPKEKKEGGKDKLRKQQSLRRHQQRPISLPRFWKPWPMNVRRSLLRNRKQRPRKARQSLPKKWRQRLMKVKLRILLQVLR